MDLKQYISQRLSGMKSNADRMMLLETMEEVFVPMFDHVESEYAKLRNRVREEMPSPAGTYVIWTTLMERENADGGSPYLFPMVNEDLEPLTLELLGLAERLFNEGEVRIDTVFVQADYLLCREIDGNREIYEGTLRTSGGDIRIGVRLRQSKHYQKRIEELYRLFISNGIPWQTVSAPYVSKMFDVMLVRIDAAGKGAQGIASDYNISFGKYDSHIKRGLVPVWNVRRLAMKSEDFPLAALDKVNYEYKFDLSEQGTQHGYLADYGSEDISSVRREGNSMVVTSPTQKGLIWDMHQIAMRREYATERFEYELMSNAQDDSFAGRMLGYYGTVVKTNAELRRLLASYSASRYVELLSARVVQGDVIGETYDANSFLKDEMRDPSTNRTLLLEFTSLNRDSFLLRDAMSFLVSQAQVLYPEFKCVGVLA